MTARNTDREHFTPATCDWCDGCGGKTVTVGGSGDPEQDVPSLCSECYGLGSATAAKMLRALITVRRAHHAAVAAGQSGLGAAVYARVREAIDCCNVESVIMAEESE